MKAPVLFFLLAAALPLTAQNAAEKAPLLKPNDVVRLEVFDEPDLTKQVRINTAGQVSLPLIETVQIGGLTIPQATDTIRNLFIEKRFLVDPKVTLVVDEVAKDFISVVGCVKNTGQFPIPENGALDLSTALAGAGGLTPEADVNGIVLRRANGETATYSAAAIRTAKIPLRPGDQVDVRQSAYVNKTVTIVGHVGKSGQVPFPVDGRLDLVTAIAFAGGFTELANQKNVSINRKGKVVEMNVKEMTDKGSKPYYLQPDDIVTVKERFF